MVVMSRSREPAKRSQLLKTTTPKSINTDTAKLMTAWEFHWFLRGLETNCAYHWSSFVELVIGFFFCAVSCIRQPVTLRFLCSRLNQSVAFLFVATFLPVQYLAFFETAPCYSAATTSLIRIP